MSNFARSISLSSHDFPIEMSLRWADGTWRTVEMWSCGMGLTDPGTVTRTRTSSPFENVTDSPSVGSTGCT